jgi:hypothetical protein
MSISVTILFAVVSTLVICWFVEKTIGFHIVSGSAIQS